MFSPFRIYGFAALAGLSLVVSSGCNGDKSKPDAEKHAEHSEDMPKSFVAAVAEIKEHAPEVKAAFEEGKPEEAHDVLHHLGEIFDSMNGLIDSSDLTDDKKAQAKEASEALFDQYTKLDTEVLHEGNTELKYEDVGAKIDEALAKLTALVPAGADHEDHASEETP